MKPDETGPRKPYVKPQLTRVTLRPEEAVLAACKNVNVGGPGQPTCNSPAACFDPASCDRMRGAPGHADMSGARPTRGAAAN